MTQLTGFTEQCFGPVAGILLVIGAGSIGFSHVNDSGLWIVKEYFGMPLTDMFKTDTMTTAVAVAVGLAGVLLLAKVVG